MSGRYVHIGLRVRDPEASVRFYRALGFEPRGRLNFSSARATARTCPSSRSSPTRTAIASS